MIDVRELRIGSRVSCDGHIGRISGIRNDSIDFEYRDDNGFIIAYIEHPIEDIYPVQLSEEILLKCGFIEQRQSFFLKINELFSLRYYFETMFDSFHCYAYLNKIINHPKGGGHMDTTEYELNIKHLHQLQNLYFALTGEELEVKL